MQLKLKEIDRDTIILDDREFRREAPYVDLPNLFVKARGLKVHRSVSLDKGALSRNASIYGTGTVEGAQLAVLMDRRSHSRECAVSIGPHDDPDVTSWLALVSYQGEARYHVQGYAPRQIFEELAEDAAHSEMTLALQFQFPFWTTGVLCSLRPVNGDTSNTYGEQGRLTGFWWEIESRKDHDERKADPNTAMLMQINTTLNYIFMVLLVAACAAGAAQIRSWLVS